MYSRLKAVDKSKWQSIFEEGLSHNKTEPGKLLRKGEIIFTVKIFSQ